MNHSRIAEFWCRDVVLKWLLAAAGVVLVLVPPTYGLAQNESGGTDAGSCTLKDHVYSCNGAAFQAALLRAKTVAIDVHNADGVARMQLTDLLTKKLDKTIAVHGGPADLISLMMPIDPSGIVYGSVDADLGTLRVYSPAPDGTRGHLLWAETYSGRQGFPWPLVVRSLILQFRARFRISN